MRANFSHILPGLLALMFAVALSASAQDDVPGPNVNPGVSNLFSQDAPIYDDKPLLMEQSVRSNADSLQQKPMPIPTSKTKADPKKAQAEGDPLNFNFLYYIIQKFKASELMME